MNANTTRWNGIVLRGLAVLGMITAGCDASVHADYEAVVRGVDRAILVGRLVNNQNMPVDRVSLRLVVGGKETSVTARSRADGWFVMELPDDLAGDPMVVCQRRHFQTARIRITPAQVAALKTCGQITVGTVVIPRKKTAAFWITLAVFLLMMVLIGATPMHNALASLVGASLLLATSALGHIFSEDLIVYDFAVAIGAVDWNVIILIMGMMIVIAVVEGTGLFRWLAFIAYKKSGGRLGKLMIILMVMTAVSSAFLDNVTTMLLMAPITIRIALAMGVDPLVLLMPEVLASNVGGLSTMVGTPTNILIASYSGISFGDFLLNLSPGVLLALAGVTGYCLYRYRRQVKASASEASPELLARLEQGAVIAEPGNLKKVGWVGLGMLVLFLVGEQLHLTPAVIALMGATSLLVWIKPNVEEMIEAVDWTTLVFFITLFMVIGALQEVGFIDQIAVWVAYLVGDSPVLAMIVITWMAALISTVIPNIPFTATMLPVVGYLTVTIPGVGPQSLFFCLAVGAAMGGNGSLIGASANLVTAGIAERAGYSISFGHFFKVGFPALLISVSLGMLWLLIRYAVF